MQPAREQTTDAPRLALGYHLLLELHGCERNRLDNVPTVEQLLREAADAAGATILNSAFHHFSPEGVSGVLVIAESHIAAHTWPEYGYAAIDCFTCGDSEILERVENLIVDGFKAARHSRKLIQRGPDRGCRPPDVTHVLERRSVLSRPA